MLKANFIITLITTLFFTSCISKQSHYKTPVSKIDQKDQTIYTVKKGDSLWQISRRYNISPKEIMAANNLDSPRKLKISQKLIIPFKQYKNNQFIWPAQGKIITFYNQKINKTFSRGIDIKLSKKTNIFAANSGKVTFSNNLGGWGETIVLEHPNNFYTIYANLERITVRPGQKVKRGEVIALSGAPGKNTVYFEIRENYIPKNPLKYLN